MIKYSEQQIQNIKNLWLDEKLSATQVAEKFNAENEKQITRCCVIGLMARNGYQKKNYQGTDKTC